MTPLRGTSSISFLIVLLTSTITNPTSPPAALMALIVLTIVLPVDNTSSIIATFFPETCPYLFDKIKKSIHKNIPLAYSPSQTEEAQNQILSRILQSKITQKEIDKESRIEFTD